MIHQVNTNEEESFVLITVKENSRQKAVRRLMRSFFIIKI
jgi:hypothetical protein